MSYDIRKPMITESTERGQLLQIKSYLIQLVDQLNFALRALERGAGNASTTEGEPSLKLTAGLFSEIKSLIMKSSDIINAYYEKMEPKFGEKIKEHNTAKDSHADIRALIEELTKKLGELEGGENGTDGEDGVSPTVEVSKTESVTTITITDVNGPQTATINDGYTPVKGVDYFDGKDGKDGTNGKDGYTPVKGTDYYTEADKNEMVSRVLASLPTWNGGSY